MRMRPRGRTIYFGGIHVELLRGFSTMMCYSWNKAGSTFVNVDPRTVSE
jgi:hypothetical protein